MAKKISLAFLALFMACCTFSACNCSLAFDKDKTVDRVQYCYGKFSSYAFCWGYEWGWDCDNMRFSVADTVEGHRVEELGGYAGRGVPIAFMVYFKISNSSGTWDDSLPYGSTAEIVPLTFTAEIGSALRKSTLRRDHYYYYDGEKERTGELDVIYEVNIRYELRAENQYFTTIDGVLVRK